MSFLYACPGISPQRRRASSSQTSYRSLSVQARKVRSFRCFSSPQKVFRLSGDPRVSSSSHSHIPIGRLFSCQRTNIPSLITSGRGYFFGCFEKIFLSFHLFPPGKAICTPVFKNISSYIRLLKNPSEINPLNEKYFYLPTCLAISKVKIIPLFKNFRTYIPQLFRLKT